MKFGLLLDQPLSGSTIELAARNGINETWVRGAASSAAGATRPAADVTELDAAAGPQWLVCDDATTMLAAARLGVGAFTTGFATPENVVDHLRAYERVLATECVPLSSSVNTSVAVVKAVTTIDDALVRDLQRFELAGVDQIVIALPADDAAAHASIIERLGRDVVPEFAARDAVRTNGKRLRLSPLVEIALSKRPG